MGKNLRSYVVEMIGTFILVFVAAGSVCVEHLIEQPKPGLAGIALASGFALAAALAFALPLSEDEPSGYLNPAIAVTLWVFKRLEGGRTIALIFVQLLGAALAGGALRLIFMGREIVMTSAHLGTPHLNLKFWDSAGVTPTSLVSGLLIEMVITFILTMVIFATLMDPRAPRLLGRTGRWLAPLWVGLILGALVLAGFSLTGAAANPARWFGTVIWESSVAALREQHPFADQMVYWVGPCLGALLAGIVYAGLILPAEEEAVAIHAPSGKAQAGHVLSKAKK